MPPSLEGPCHVQARIDGNGMVIDPEVHAGVYELPMEGSLRWHAALRGSVRPGARRTEGAVRLDLPAPLSDVTLAHWDDRGRLAEHSGVYSYRIPLAFAPVGARIAIRASYRETGVDCSATVHLRLAGGFFDSVLPSLAVALATLGAGGVALAAQPVTRAERDRFGRPTGRVQRRPRTVAGSLYGLVSGSGAAFTLLLSRMVELQSPVLTALPLLGLLIGAAVARWAISGRPAAVTTTPGTGEIAVFRD